LHSVYGIYVGTKTANQNLALNSIVGAAFGAAGQRCMAISVGMQPQTAMLP